MSDEDALLRKILENPADDVTRLVYADWLEEQDNHTSHLKAEFLRLEVEIENAKTPPPKTLLQKLRMKAYDSDPAKPIRERLKELASVLDPEWMAVVGNQLIERCGLDRWVFASPKPQLADPPVKPKPQFEFECPKQWNELETTDDPNVRACLTCQQHVYFCDTMISLQEHVRERHCVAVSLSVIRFEGDVEPVEVSVMMGLLESVED